MNPTETTDTALLALLESLIDYAGLFPPAGLDMATAVANYAKYKESPYGWMLGRFIVPAARLAEFAGSWKQAGAPAGWQLSAVVSNPAAEMPMIEAFNAKLSGHVQIDAVEVKANSVEDIRGLQSSVTTYVEIPTNENPMALVVGIKTAKHRAKIRTGGTTASAIPDAAAVARFLRACASISVPFKATAGLHHPIRSVQPLTYEANSQQATMHGFLNLFLAAAFSRQGHPQGLIEKVLAEESSRAIVFDSEGVTWGGGRLKTAYLRETREKFAIAFGSCSFEEPVRDLQALGLLS